MKITNSTGIYTKNIKPFIKLFWDYFDNYETNTKNVLRKSAALVRCFNSKKIYFTLGEGVVVDISPINNACNIVLDTYIENKTVCCEDTVTLLFPTIEEVLDYEKIAKGE